MNGFIKLHRKILTWGWFADPPTLSVFLALLIMADYRDAVWKGTPLKRGQVITSRAALSKTCGLSQQQVRTALRHLISTGEITGESTSRYTLITIVNYGLYQDAGEESGQPDDRETHRRSTGCQPAANHSVRKKEEKEEKNRVYAAPNPATETGNGEANRAPRFVPPTAEEVDRYCRERGYALDAERFCDHYRANGWRIGKAAMRDWRAAVRNWAKNEFSGPRRPAADGYALPLL